MSDRFTRVTSSTQLIGIGDRADRRNADQIRFQTSGEVGKFYIDAEPEAVKLGKTLLTKPAARETINPTYETASEFKSAPVTTRSSASKEYDIQSARTGRSTARSDIGSSRGGASPAVGRAQYMSTLQQLDRSFSNGDRRDLFAASMPGRPSQELVWCAANNNRGAQQSKGWAQRLRKESTISGL